ncbi:3-oxoacyl-ACP synthase III family protein [Amycolatopsis anabasis]|uniref:3-oxoacyl-ACP synthase III family protein n=1 Tax=Amycolatopsis anabasis TaxID=1840409 RepID=UPI00131AD49F|nr:3-oxoacyl-ACP synthase III family protein [Amycolatopsis anabasis]
MPSAHLIGTGGCLPGAPIPTSVIAELAGPLPDEVAEGLSIRQRHWIIDPVTGEHHTSNSELAYRAVVRALADAEVEPAEVDLLVCSTGTPDYPLPPVVNLVQERLGLARCATLELRSGGAGAVQGLDIARMYLERGVHRTAVVVGSEAISPVLAPVYLGRDPERIRMRDRMPLYMFGDGAGAIVLRADAEPGGVRGAAMAAIGGDRPAGIRAVGGGTHAPIHRQLEAKRLVELKVDVVGAGDFTPVLVTEAIAATLRATGLPANAVDACVLPEGNVNWMLDSLTGAGLDTGDWRALEGRILDSLPTMGAVGSAAVPLFLDEARRSGRVKPGHRVLLIGLEATKWIYAGALLDL